MFVNSVGKMRSFVFVMCSDWWFRGFYGCCALVFDVVCLLGCCLLLCCCFVMFVWCDVVFFGGLLHG